MDWKNIYNIGKFLELKCLKWVCMTNLDTWNTSYGKKKGPESNWQFDSRPLKVVNHPNFLTFRWHATYCWKSQRGIQFFFKPHLNWRFARKIMGPKVARVPVVGISRLPLGSPGTKWHLGVSHVARHRISYKGEGGGFPQVQAVVSHVNLSLLVARLSTKSVPVMN